MRSSTDTRIGEVNFFFVGADVGEQILEVGLRHLWLGDQRHRNVNHGTNRDKVFQRFEIEFAIQRRRGGHADVVEQQRITVTRRARDLAGANGAAGAANVFNNHRTFDLDAHRLRERSRNDVSRAACRKRHHNRDWLVGISGKCAPGGNGAEDGSAEQRNFFQKHNTVFREFNGGAQWLKKRALTHKR